MLIRIPLMGVFALVLGACGGAAQPAAPQPTSTAQALVAVPNPTAAFAPTAAPQATAAPAPAAPPSDAKTAVLNAFKAQFAGGPFRSVIRQGANDAASTMQAEFIPPTKMHITHTLSDTTTEMVIIGDTLWNKTNGTWTKAPGSQQTTTLINQMVNDPETNGVAITNALVAGPDVINGEQTWVYTYNSTFGEGANAITSTNKLWVSVARGLPLMLEGTVELGGNTSTTVQTITYDDSITIEPPL